MKSFSRSERVGALILEITSGILQKHIDDPRLQLATITGVKMSSDLRYARIYFSISGGSAKVKAALDGFKSAHGFIKRTLASQLDLRYMPEIDFFYDESFDYGSRIDNLLKSIAAEDNHAEDNAPAV